MVCTPALTAVVPPTMVTFLAPSAARASLVAWGTALGSTSRIGLPRKLAASASGKLVPLTTTTLSGQALWAFAISPAVW